MTYTNDLRTLGIRNRPTKAAIKQAFRDAAKKYHPDAQGEDADFIRLKKAYDSLMRLSLDELSRISSPAAADGRSDSYDPFEDLDYDRRVFFEPSHPNSESVERRFRARNCPFCHGLGSVTKNTNPSLGFMGRERRFCRCQWVE